MSLEDTILEMKELYQLGEFNEEFADWRAAYKAQYKVDSTLTDNDLVIIMAASDDAKNMEEWVADMIAMEHSIAEGKIQHAS
jgi:hypothetical protein